MASILLQGMPREIRDQIYLHVLAPTGVIYFVPVPPFRINGRFKAVPSAQSLLSSDPTEAISLSILRTCKQIYEECKDLFWEHNTVRLNDVNNFFGHFKRFPFDLIRHAEISIEFHELGESSKCFSAFHVLLSLEYLGMREGHSRKMETLTLRPTISLQDIFENMLKKRDSQTILPGILELYPISLRSIPSWNSLGQAKRKILLDLDLRHLASIDFEDPEKEMKVYERMEKAMTGINAEFGGELWQKDTLCYKDGTEVAKVFPVEELRAMRRADKEAKLAKLAELAKKMAETGIQDGEEIGVQDGEERGVQDVEEAGVQDGEEAGVQDAES